MNEILKFGLGRVENIVEKPGREHFGKRRKCWQGENAGYQHFLLCYNVFKRLLIQVRFKSTLCGKGLKGLGANEGTGNQNFVLFTQFLLLLKNKFH